METEVVQPVEENDSLIEEEHLIEYINENEEAVEEFSNEMFPINDEGTFDWFMNRLKDEEFQNNLISTRWHLTRDCGTRSFNVSIKDFLKFHFDLSVVIKYSVSGYGSRGTKKKKLDAKTLSKYVYECFNRAQPGINSYQDVCKAVTQFWGRSPDNYAKTFERSIKKEEQSKVTDSE
jgi:hypothetical protein